MAQKTKISWCDATFNPWIGCVEVGGIRRDGDGKPNAAAAGCANCYARIHGERMGWAEWGVRTPRHITSESTWKQPRAWNRKAAKSGKRMRVFCASLSDVFENHPGVVEARKRLFALIKETPNLDWLLLTKRPQNILSMLPPDWGEGGYDNVWLGTSVEDMRVAHRLDKLRAVPAAIRFVSYEPALGPIDQANVDGIHWLICGGESGGAHWRPMDEAWATAMRDRCKQLGVAFFFKQHAGKHSGMQPTLQGVKHHAWPRSRRLRKQRVQTGVGATKTE